jgi:hypothetical protein
MQAACDGIRRRTTSFAISYGLPFPAAAHSRIEEGGQKVATLPEEWAAEVAALRVRGVKAPG